MNASRPAAAGLPPLEVMLAELVATPSISGEEAEAAALVRGWLDTAGIEHEALGHTVLARVRRGTGPRLLLHSHLDTVPAGAAWTVEPWAAEWRHGVLMGLGANDAKGCAVAMLDALVRFAHGSSPTASDGTAGGEVLLALNACEETNNAGMEAILAHVGPPDGAVCGEPTGLEVVRAQAGLVVLEAHWSGRSCHAAHVARVDHDNAMLRAAEELQAVAPYLVFEEQHPLLGASTLAPTELHAGDRHNRVPDRARAVFDARLSPPHDAAACQAWLSERLPSAEVHVRSERLKPVETPAAHPFVGAAVRAAGREQAIGSNTLSDMALLPGVPAVKCGPGETCRSHTPDEFLRAEELAAGALFYAEVVASGLASLSALTPTHA